MTDRPSIAVVRGEALNPFEMQAYRPLVAEFDLLLVGRTNPLYEVGLVGLPTRLLRSTNGSRLTAAAARRLGRTLPALGEGRLLGLARAVAGREVLHAAETAIPFSAQCAEIAGRTGAKLVLTCWENIPFRFEEDERVAQRKRFVQDACDLFIAVTPSAKAALVDEGVDGDRVVVVPAGVDTTRFRPDSQAPGARALLGVSDDAVLAVFIGRLIPEKGLVELIRAVAMAAGASDASNVHLLIVGSGPELTRVRSAATALKVSNRIHVLSGVSYAEVPGLWAMADIAVVPSLPAPYWQEQFGMVLAEAMSSGVPVIATRSGSIPEVVGDAALLVTPYDVEELATALRDLAADLARRADLAARGRGRAEDIYAVDVVAAQLAAAYRRVLAS
jgi:glycosyltransferase involved in cell wall biosynthesis